MPNSIHSWQHLLVMEARRNVWSKGTVKFGKIEIWE